MIAPCLAGVVTRGPPLIYGMASSSNAKAEQLEPLLRLRKDSLIEDDGTGPCVKVYPPDGWVFFNKEGEVEKSALVPFYKQDTTFKKSTDQSEQEPSAAAATAINAATDTSTPAPKEVYQDKWKSFREWAKPKLKTSDAELSVKLDDLKKNCKLETKQGPLLLLQKAEKRLGRQEWKVEPDTLEALPKEPKKVRADGRLRANAPLTPSFPYAGDHRRPIPTVRLLAARLLRRMPREGDRVSTWSRPKQRSSHRKLSVSREWLRLRSDGTGRLAELVLCSARMDDYGDLGRDAGAYG